MKMMEIFEKVSVKFVLLFIMFIGLIFAYWAGVYTHNYPMDYCVEKMDGNPDSIIRNILALCVALLRMFCLQKFFLKDSFEENEKLLRSLFLVECIVIGCLLLLWIAYSHTDLQADQIQVYWAANSFLNGDYSDMLPGHYTNIYPHQYGLTFLYEIIFSLTFSRSYKIIQIINVVCIVLIIYYGDKLVKEIFANQTIEFYYLLLLPAFLPLYLYSTFVYGDIFATAASVICSFLVIRWCKEEKKKSALGIIIWMTLAVTARRNTWVIVIAIIMVLVIHAIKEKRWKSALVAFLLVTIPFLCMSLIEVSYEKRSGMEIGEGIPSIMWIAMGMQDTWNGPGFYNGYSNIVYTWDANMDSRVCSEIGKEYIKERAKEFSEDLGYAKRFFCNKLLYQWNDHTFSSFILTKYFDEEPTGFVYNVYYGKLHLAIIEFMQRYIFVLYLGMAAGAFYLLCRKTDLYVCLPLIGIIGGVLFSILWEAKGRYVLSYVVLIIPYAAAGIYGVQWAAQKVKTKWRKAIEGKKKNLE